MMALADPYFNLAALKVGFRGFSLGLRVKELSTKGPDQVEIAKL